MPEKKANKLNKNLILIALVEIRNVRIRSINGLYRSASTFRVKYLPNFWLNDEP